MTGYSHRNNLVASYSCPQPPGPPYQSVQSLPATRREFPSRRVTVSFISLPTSKQGSIPFPTHAFAWSSRLPYLRLCTASYCFALWCNPISKFVERGTVVRGSQAYNLVFVPVFAVSFPPTSILSFCLVLQPFWEIYGRYMRERLDCQGGYVGSTTHVPLVPWNARPRCTVCFLLLLAFKLTE